MCPSPTFACPGRQPEGGEIGGGEESRGGGGGGKGDGKLEDGEVKGNRESFCVGCLIA